MRTYILEYSREIGRRAYVRLSIKRQGGYHIGVVIIAGFSILGTIQGNALWLSGFGIGISVAYVYYFWIGMRDYETRFDNKKIEIEMHDDHIRYELEGMVSTIEWRLVKELLKLPDIWILLSKDEKHCSIFPLKEIDSEGKAFIEAKVLENGAKIT